MQITRRTALAIGAGALAAGMLPLRAMAALEDDIATFTGGAEMGEGDITLTTPEIAENGNTVPVSVSAPGAVEIFVLAAGNPAPPVATFKFGPLSGSRSASTRMRLAATQDVVAIAKLEDGSFIRTSNLVKVTIGGCGG